VAHPRRPSEIGDPVCMFIGCSLFGVGWPTTNPFAQQGMGACGSWRQWTASAGLSRLEAMGLARAGGLTGTFRVHSGRSGRTMVLTTIRQRDSFQVATYYAGAAHNKNPCSSSFAFISWVACPARTSP